MVDSEPGRVTNLLFPVQGANLLWGVVDLNYPIRSLSATSGSPTTLVTSTDNAGAFIATATTVYYETWMGTTDATALTVTRSGRCPGPTTPPQPRHTRPYSKYAASPPWSSRIKPRAINTPRTASAAHRSAVDTTSNQVLATIGTLPVSTATVLSGTFRGSADTGFLEASNPVSTQDPATRDLYLLNSQTPNSLIGVIGNL